MDELKDGLTKNKWKFLGFLIHYKNMLIYKYTPFYSGKLIIDNGSVRFSQVEVLNDPSELTPSMNKFRRSIKDFVRNTDNFKEISKKMSYIEKEASLKKIVQPSIDAVLNLTKNHLILSLTKREDNYLMWSHYADSHKGIVIGFDYDNKFFHQRKHPQITCSYDVNYSNKKPEFFDFRNFWAGSISVDAYRKMLLTKSIDWKYEEEVRMFASALAGKNVGKDNNEFDIYLYDFPRECVKKIMFGSQISKTNRDELVKIANKKYPNAELFEVIQNQSGFGLKLKAYKI